MLSIKPYFAFCVAIVFAGVALAQANDELLLNHITTLQGLSSNDIRCIFQDGKGFIWIGTFDGLNRYDGKNIKVFRRNISDSTSLIGNWITSITEDASGNLWIGTSVGVSRLNAGGGQFTNYYPAQLFPGQKCMAGEQKVFKDNNGKIWVCSGGLSYFEEKNARFIPQPFIPPAPAPNYNINQLVFTITVDKKGDFWMGTLAGLYRYNVAGKRYTKYDDNPPQESYVKHGDLLSNVNILNDREILFTPWSDKIYALNTETDTAKVKTVVQLHNKMDLRVFSVEWNGRKEFWAAHNDGIVRFGVNLNKIGEWHSAPSQTSLANTLSGNVKTIYQSKENIIFVGTTDGVIIINPYLQLFKTWHVPTNPNVFSGAAGSITSITFSRGKMFAGALYSNAVYIIDSNWHVQHAIKAFSPITVTESSTNTYDGINDADGFIWLATFQGLVKLDPETAKYKVYLPPQNDPLFYRHKRFLFIQSTGNKLWLVNYKQDMLSFDKKTEKFRIFRPFGAQRNIWGLLACGDNVWFTSGNMLARYNQVMDTTIIFVNNKAPEVAYENVIQGKKNELWVTSGYGIWRYNTQTGEWHNWNTADGLCNDNVNDILFDKIGHLWVTTINGISAFDTAQKIFYNFNSQNGLPRDNWAGALAMNNTGSIFLGNDKLITCFNPSMVIRPSANYPAFITGCQVNGRDFALPQGTTPHKTISLNYNENNLNFQFTVVNILQPYQTTYYYKLEGFDTDWHLSPTGVINYTNLYASNYILRVSSNPFNGAAGGDALFITINSPFWAKWWFLLAIMLFVGTVTIYGFRMRINTIRKEANRRAAISQQVADLRMKALRSQMNPHFLFNSLNAIQECCLTGQMETAVQYLARFSKLVRFILENSSKQWISLKEEIDILKLYLDVESLRFTNSFTYSIENNVQVNGALLKIPPMLVQPFAENAIWHGLLHKNGERHVWIRFYNDEEKLYVEVEDNGVGRSEQKTTDHTPMGMGIIRQRVKLIEEIQQSSATIDVIDKKDSYGNALGTIVKLKLPLL